MRISTIEERQAYVQHQLDTATPTFHQLPDTNYTICVLTLENGFQFTGKAVCVSANDYDWSKGCTISFDNAQAEAETYLWRVLGFCAHLGLEELPDAKV